MDSLTEREDDEPESSGAGPPCKPSPGLHLVATPIGNLGDVTLRALDLLRGVEAIACEDTRVTARLLARYGIETPTLAYHEHNATRMRPRLLARLSAGAALALVSDAGTPLISDPGYKLVRACLGENIAVSALPGANAALTALVLSGLPTDRFLFLGYLPPKSAARRQAITEVAAVRASLVLYESPQRLAASLADLAAVLGPRAAAVARELTKKFEEIRRDSLAALADHYAAAGPPKGEIVVVVAPPAAEALIADLSEVEQALQQALAEMSLRDAATAVAEATGWPRRKIYDLALTLTRGNDHGDQTS
ncbi:MAG: 16S rRNA (cytidine(1402)-2'-O)-methyltransferase [Azospirillum sp.]|nr:16S rRNA (cytidine(1402)-2'-O)-methyltransferase [Azospirillum sp.]